MRDFRKYDIWLDGRRFVNLVYDATDKFPAQEKFGLTSQLNRAAVSIILNIAEGASRKSEKEFSRFLEIEVGSAFEVETVLLISTDRGMVQSEESIKLIEDLHSIHKRLNGFIQKLKT